MLLPIYYLGGTIFSGGGLISSTLPTHTVTVIRPDGKQIQFSKISGVWQNQSYIAEHLTETDDSNGNTTGYTYTTADDNTENYDATGRLQSITDIAVTRRTLSYDRQGVFPPSYQYCRVADVQLRYQQPHQHDNRSRRPVWLYGYDANNNLASVTYPDATIADNTDNPERVYLYENTSFPHALTSITDCAHVSSCSTSAVNHYANFEYDAQRPRHRELSRSSRHR